MKAHNKSARRLTAWRWLIPIILSAAPAWGEEEMAYIPAGEYRPLYTESDVDGGQQGGNTKVAAFYLDKTAVTNGQYLAFVRTHPRWQKSAAIRRPLFADAAYLAHWQADLTPGALAPSDAPVVNISWFAARTYCKWRDKRLPTVAQWEYAALASEDSTTAALDDTAFRQRIMEWYARPAGLAPTAPEESFQNIYGVRDMHGLIWEWTRDFNNALVTGASRSDSTVSRNLFCGGGAVGAADFSDYAAFMRFASRASVSGNYAVSSLGFRCARAGQKI